MSRRHLATAASALVIVGGLAGCGGDSTVIETLTTDQSPTTAPAPTAPAASAPTTTAAPTATTGRLRESDLPALTSVEDVRSGTVRTLDDPQAFVDALYQAGDPSKPQARTRLEDAGYSGAVLRDQEGEDASTGIALLRSYVLGLRDDAAAQDEVDRAADEVKSASSAPTTDIDLPEVPGARALRVDIDQGGVKGAVVFATFAVGSRVYGIQGVSGGDAAVPQDDLLQAARDLHAEVTAAP